MERAFGQPGEGTGDGIRTRVENRENRTAQQGIEIGAMVNDQAAVQRDRTTDAHLPVPRASDRAIDKDLELRPGGNGEIAVDGKNAIHVGVDMGSGLRLQVSGDGPASINPAIPGGAAHEQSEDGKVFAIAGSQRGGENRGIERGG